VTVTPGEIVALPSRELAARVRAGELAARDVIAAHAGRIELVDAQIGAFVRTTFERAHARAETIDRGARTGALCGVPFGLKDLFVTEGVETTAGSRILAGWIPPYQGGQMARLAAAGGVLVGKLALDEFAMGSSSENTPFRAVRNPWALDHVAGGSSGGSAAAVAAGMVPLALGTDTGGSIRQPASLCGVVGIKPTYGRVTRHGMVAFASSLDQAGPIARDVRDAALALGVLAGHDPLDATSLEVPVPDLLAACERGCAGLRVGVHRRALDSDGVDAEVASAFAAALDVLARGGATLVDVELPHAERGIACYYVLCTAEAASNLARYDGVRYGARVEGESLVATYEATRAAGFGAEVKRRILLGTFVLRKDSYAEYYGRAQRVRTLVARDYDEAFARCDVIASPTSPVPGFRMGERTADPLAMYLADVFTVGANLAGLPAISIPCGHSRAVASRPALPIGLQLVGPRLGEEVVLAAAAAHEDATAWHRARPPEVAT
jgi:aspartyl-tRNA(Asn)/glutamyl-tRNA(Gln) amidotransferase subunit A